MAEKVYESMFIFNSNAYARNPGNASNSIKEIVDSVGGKLLASRMWNEQKLAYPINGQRKGVYWLSYVQLDGDALPKFNRACQLNDIILRHLVITIDPRLVEPLVAAANDERPVSETGGTTVEKSEATEAKEGDSATSEKGSEKGSEKVTAKAETVAAD